MDKKQLEELAKKTPVNWKLEDVDKVFDRESFEHKIDDIIEWLYEKYNIDFGVYVGMVEDSHDNLYPTVVTLYKTNPNEPEKLVMKSHLNHVLDKF